MAAPRQARYNGNMKTITRTLIMFFILPFAQASANAEVPKTTLIEYYSMPLCTYSPEQHGLLKRIASKNTSIMVINCPITYDGSLNDPGIPFCQKRGGVYKRNQNELGFRADQIAIQGQYFTRTNFPKALTSGVKLALSQPQAIFQPMTMDGNMLHLSLPDLQATLPVKATYLTFFALAKKHRFTIPVSTDHAHDENGNHITPATPITEIEMEDQGVSMINTVIHGKKLGPWDGSPETIGIDLEDIKADTYLVIAQDEIGGPIRLMATYSASTKQDEF